MKNLPVAASKKQGATPSVEMINSACRRASLPPLTSPKCSIYRTPQMALAKGPFQRIEVGVAAVEDFADGRVAGLNASACSAWKLAAKHEPKVTIWSPS